MPVAERRTRAWILLIITVILALLAGSALFALLGRGPAWLTGRMPPGDVVGAPAVRPDLAGAVGVNLDRSELAAPDLPQRLAELAAAKVRWVRVRLPWDEVEPARGQFRWAEWDRIMAALAAQPELQPLLVLDGAPAWARPAVDAADPLAPPQTRADFGVFAAAVARRYGAQVRYYQVWDEPNIAPHWGARPVDPAAYVGLLREAAINLRAADPAAQIVLAALAPNGEPGGANQADTSFLDGVYAAGGRAWFDIAAGEPYGFSQAPGAVLAPGVLNFGRAALLRDVMLRHDDAATPLWATAFGWNALPEGWTGPESPWGQVSEAEQARYAADALALARGRWPWLGPLFWAVDCPPTPADGVASARVAPRAADDPWRGFALCRPDGARRPAWQALTAAAAAPAVLAPGSHAMDHPALQYSPGWRVTPAAADPHANGDRLSFTFYGTDLALRIQGGPFWAYDRISVDGQPANALPRDEGGAAYLALADPLAETRTVAVARGLPLGAHQVVLEANGGWDQWALRGVLVESARPARLPGGRLVGLWLGLLAALAAGAWAVVAWPWRPAAGGWLGRADAWAASRPPALRWGVVAILGATFLLAHAQAVSLLALAALAALFLCQPAAMLPLIAASIPFWAQPKIVVRWQFAPYELLIWVGAATLALRWILLAGSPGTSPQGDAPRGALPLAKEARPGDGRRAPFVWLRGLGAAHGLLGLDWAVLALVLVGLAASLTAQRVGVALREWRMVFLDAGLFYLLITRLLSICRPAWLGAGANRALTPAGRRRDQFQDEIPKRTQDAAPRLPGPAVWPLLDGLLAGMSFVSALALWQLSTGQGRIDVEGVWRVRAFYGSPNNLALVLDRAVPLAVAVALFAPAAGPARLRRWLYAGAALIMAAACLATFSKGALLLGLPAGVGLVVLGGAWRSRRRWPLALLAGAVALILLSLGLLFQTQRFADLTDFEAGTSFIRLKLWQGAWHMALDHPWLGVGPDNFLYAYRTRYVLPGAWAELNLSHPHNILLDLWTRLGLAGLAAGIWALLAGILGAWGLFRRGGRAAWPLALGLLGGMAATVSHGLIDNSLFLIDLMALFVLALGLIQVLREAAEASL